MSAHLLFVEDDLNLSFVTQDNLEQHGFRITACADGEAGWEAFQKGNFDVAVLDVMLPKMDGFALARKIRERNPHIPILFLTAKNMKEDRLEGLRLGGDDYITKPFSIEELILRIEVFLRRSKGAGNGQEMPPVSDEYKIGSYLFQPRQQQLLSPDGKTQRLTAKESALLELFVQHKGRILKREDILQAIWQDDDYFTGRSLDVFISRLRKYLKTDKHIRIENVHGVGFVMEED